MDSLSDRTPVHLHTQRHHGRSTEGLPVAVGPPGLCPGPRIRPLASEARNINDEKDDCPVNVYFTIDTSESVALREFPWGSLVEELKVFLQMFVERLQTTTLRAKRVQWAYGGLHFSDRVEVFSQVVTDAAVFLGGHSHQVHYSASQSATVVSTLVGVPSSTVPEEHDRAGEANGQGKARIQYAVVLTDGHITGSPCGGVSRAAEAAKAAGIKIFVVATNEETMESELKQIASSPVAWPRRDLVGQSEILDSLGHRERLAPLGHLDVKETLACREKPVLPVTLVSRVTRASQVKRVLLGRVAGLDHRVMVETVEIRVKLDLVEVLAALENSAQRGGHQVSQGSVVYQVRVERQDFRALRGMQGTLAPEETLEQQELREYLVGLSVSNRLYLFILIDRYLSYPCLSERMLMNILNFQECEIMGFVRETCGCCDCEKVCPPLDLVFVIDSSESIGKTNFSLAKHFVISVANRLGKMARNISDVSGFRLGVVQYSHQGAVQAIRMDDRGITSATSFNTKVKAMEWIAGGTWTPSALKYTYDHLIVPGRRGRTKTVAIVITDGRYDPKDLDNLGALCNGVDVYAIAIGDMFDSGAERQNMERIACNMGDRVKTLSVYAELTAEEFLEEIEQILCPEPEMMCPDLKCASDLSLAPLIQRPADILFFIDGSERTGGRNFISILRFIERLSQSIPLSKEVSSGARFAVLQFGGEQDPEVLLDFSNNHRKISSLVSNAVYRDSSSTLGSAILYATENLVSNPGGRFRGVRPDAELAFVFITDGVTSDKNFAEGIGAMRRANAVGVAITVGSDIDRERLLQLTLRDKALIFNLKSFNDLALPGVVKHMAHCLG
nr:collagen alpha-2(VI) chain-like [Salvelinus alpinus]